jgi:hypothetical protein
LLSAVALLQRVPPADGYEISIYGAYPWYFWIVLAGAIFTGQLVILRSASSERDDGRLWVFGVALALLGNFVLLFIPYVRGYPVYGRSDVLSHLGFVRDLTELGISVNIYPPTHILTQSLAGATGLEPMTVINLLPIAFSAIFFGSMYFLVVYLFGNHQLTRFYLPLVLIPIAGTSHVTPVPYVLSVLLVPFVLYLLVREQRTGAIPVRGMLLVGIVGVVVFHPLTAVFTIIVFVLYAGIKRLPPIGATRSKSTNIASLTIVVFSAWYVNFAGIIFRFQRIIGTLLGRDAGESPLDQTTGTIARTSPEIVDVLQIAAFKYGIDVLLFGFALLFIAIVALLWWQRGIRPEGLTLLFAGTTLLFLFTAVLFLTNDLITGFGRPLAFGKPFAVVLTAALFYFVRQNAGTPFRREIAGKGMVLILAVILFVSVFGVFYSPLTADRNHQVTEMEIDGSEWAFENRNDDLLMDEFGISQYRFYHLQHGTERTPLTVRREDTRPPDHFNYTEYNTLGESYGEDRYLLLTRLGRITYPAKFPGYRHLWRFTPEDFDRLETDPSVARVYDNGEFDVYRIDGTAEEL